jgi:hypothetical protein
MGWEKLLGFRLRRSWGTYGSTHRRNTTFLGSNKNRLNRVNLELFFNIRIKGAFAACWEVVNKSQWTAYPLCT